MTRSKKQYIILGAILVVAVAVAVWTWTFRAAETSVENHKAEISIPASDLVAAFTNNEGQANSKYLNKIIEVKGEVSTVEEKAQEVTVYLKQEKDLSGVICSFDKKAIDVGRLKKGDQVTVKGLCSGYLMDVVFVKCAIIW